MRILFFPIFRVFHRVITQLLVMRAIVKRLSPIQFSMLLKNPEIKNLQIIDVREKNELLLASLKDQRLVNLPLSTANEWIPKLAQGEILKKDAPTVVMCHHGVRSMNAADYLGKGQIFSFAYYQCLPPHIYSEQDGLHGCF